MPTYIYKCSTCGDVFEQRMKIAERNEACCECGGEVEIQLGTPLVTWKGGPPTQPNMGKTCGRGAPNKPSDDEINDGILGPDGPYTGE
jgi:putative FmdB family regulatory protein